MVLVGLACLGRLRNMMEPRPEEVWWSLGDINQFYVMYLLFSIRYNREQDRSVKRQGTMALRNSAGSYIKISYYMYTQICPTSSDPVITST
jgi:hypothetical protein